MRKCILLFLCLSFLTVSIVFLPRELLAKKEVNAEKLAESVVDKLGKEKAWEKNRYLRFDYVVIENGVEKEKYQHLWDKTTDNYRIEWYDSDNNYVIVMFNLTNVIGTAYVNGKIVDYEKTEPFVQQAYRRFAHDSYWLFLPYKILKSEYKRGILNNPGSPDSDQYTILTLVIDQKGSIPGGKYEFYVNMKSKTIDRCRYKLHDGLEGDYYLKDWDKYGKLRLFSVLESVDGKTVIRYDNLQAFNYITPQIFDNIHIHLP